MWKQRPESDRCSHPGDLPEDAQRGQLARENDEAVVFVLAERCRYAIRILTIACQTAEHEIQISLIAGSQFCGSDRLYSLRHRRQQI